MIKKSILYCLLSMYGGVLFSQEISCTETVKTVTKTLKKKNPFKNYRHAFERLQPCADSGNPRAQNFIGLCYLQGLGVSQDEKQAFVYLQKAAQSGNAAAQYNLGRLYKYGTGCTLDMSQAVTWFEKAAQQGNHKAAYSLGYLYYKGLGLPQSYDHAIRWFRHSKDPMAQHWLGVCYYFGYGVAQNTEKAIALLGANGTANSQTFLKHIQQNKKEHQEKEVAAVVHDASAITSLATPNPTLAKTTKQHPIVAAETFTGTWVGKLIEYDYSGTVVQRILPIAMAFKPTADSELLTEITFQDQNQTHQTLVSGNSLFVDAFHFTLNKQYTHNERYPKLDYEVLGMHFQKISSANKTYLKANLDTYLPVWKEMAHPISIILRPKDDTPAALEDASLVALAAPDETFLQLYPVPFQRQLHVSFELETKAFVQAKLTAVNTGEEVVFDSGKEVDKGLQSYTIEAGQLPIGLYVVKVFVDDKIHTKTVIKM